MADEPIPFQKPSKNGGGHSTRFQKGGPGGPGRPKGSRSKTTLMAEALMSDGLEAVIETVIAEARNGDMQAARLILERLVPIRKGKPVQFELPACTDAQGLGEAFDAVIAAVASGSLTPDEGAVIAGLLTEKRKFVETEALEQRLQALEEASGKTGARTWQQ
jgi:hypothetical protein